MRLGHRILTLLFLAGALAGPAWADAPAPPPAGMVLSPGTEAAPAAEGILFHPMPVDSRLFEYDDLWLSDVGRRVQEGRATMPELRHFWGLYERLYPFERTVPGDFRLRAMEAKARLRPDRPELARTWTDLGPSTYTENGTYNSGRATCMWVDPADKNIILLGTADGGVWKTTNQGQTWTSLFDAVPTQSVGCLTVDPNNKSVVYVGTGEANNGGDNISGLGIAKSTNGGATWSMIDLPWGYNQPYHHLGRIVVDPRDSQRVYAAGDGGLYISTNAGASWTRSTCGATQGPYIGTDVVLDAVTPAQGQPSTIYAAFGYTGGSPDNKIYRSTDGGSSWAVIGDPSQWAGRIRFVQAPSNPRWIYALIHNRTVDGGASSIFYTQDASAASVTWNGGTANPNFCQTQCWYDITGAVDPQNPSKIFLGGVDAYLSTDAGASMTKTGCWNCYDQPATYSHADHHAMVMPDSQTLYDANDGGFFVGTVNGTSVSYTHRNIGLPTLQFYSLAQHPTDATKMAGGTQDNGHAYFDGTKWDMVQGGDGAGAEWDQQQGNIAYEAYVHAYIRRADNIVASPKSWTCIGNYPGCPDCNTQLCPPDGRVAFIAPMALDPNNQNTLYTGSYRLLKNASCRTGSSWTAASPDLTGNSNAYITAIHPAKNGGQSGILYVGTLDGKVQMTSNGGGNWADRTAGLATAKITGFATHPTDGNKVLVTLSGWGSSHVYRSTDGGASWTDITGGLPAIPFNCIVLDRQDPNRAIAGADMGIYENASVWSGSAWTDATGNMPMVSVHALQFNPVTGKLRAATHGRGVWETGGATQCTVSCTASAAPTSGTAPLSVTFSATATPSGCSGSPSYAWNFGDGGTSSQQNPNHTYTNAGNYAWTLTVTADGQTCTQSGTVTVSGGGGPKTLAIGNASGSAGSNVCVALSLSNGGGAATITAFTADITYDSSRLTPTGVTTPVSGKTAGGNIVSSGRYRITLYGGTGTLSDGTVASVCFNTTSGQCSPYTLAYASGTPTASDANASAVAVTGTPGSITTTGCSTCTVTCTASASPASGSAPLAVAFTATATATGCTGSPAYSWSFGDGGASTLQNPSHTYTGAGTYGWSLTVSAGGQTCSRSGSITVSGGGGARTLTLGTASGTAGSNICVAVNLSNGGQAATATAFTTDITYDASKLTPTGVTTSVAGKTAAGNIVSSGRYRITVYGGTAAFSDGAAASVCFNSTSGQCATYPLAHATGTPTASDGSANPVTLSGVGGSITPTGCGGGVPGDCDGTGTVSIGEVQKAINMFLGVQAVGCNVDCNGDGSVSIGEVQKVINVFLGIANSC